MKKLLLPLLLPLLLLLLTANCHAQDTITFKDGRQVTAKIIEVTVNTVIYKRFANLDGPRYEEYKSNIETIKYADGEMEVYNRPKPVIIEEKEKEEVVYGKNYFSYTPFIDILFSTLTFSYERSLFKGMVGLRVPVSFNLAPRWNNDSYSKPYEGETNGVLLQEGNRVFGTGLDINIYPTGMGQKKYFVGPSFAYSIFRYKYYPTPNNYNAENLDGYLYALLINNGMMINPTPHFCLSFFLGIGVARRDYKESYNNNYYGYNNNNDMQPIISSGFMAGVRF